MHPSITELGYSESMNETIVLETQRLSLDSACPFSPLSLPRGRTKTNDALTMPHRSTTLTEESPSASPLSVTSPSSVASPIYEGGIPQAPSLSSPKKSTTSSSSSRPSSSSPQHEQNKRVRFCDYDKVQEIHNRDFYKEQDLKEHIWYSRSGLQAIRRECQVVVDRARQHPERYGQRDELYGLHKFLNDNSEQDGSATDIVQEALELVLDLQYVLRTKGLWDDDHAPQQLAKLYAQATEDSLVDALDTGLLLEYELFATEDEGDL